MGLKIGNKNKFYNSTIAGGSVVILKNESTSFFHKHPILSAIIAGVIAGVILLLSFWDDVVLFIENLF